MFVSFDEGGAKSTVVGLRFVGMLDVNVQTANGSKRRHRQVWQICGKQFGGVQPWT